MIDMQAMRAELNRDEGRRKSVYQDSLGYWTLGVGFLVDARRGGECPDPVIDYWLDWKIAQVLQQLNGRFAWFEHVDPVRQRVLVNMAYNLGIDGLSEFKQMLAAVSTGDYERAADEMADSRWAKQVGDRAVRLVAMMRTGATT